MSDTRDQLKDLLNAWVDRGTLTGATALLERAERQLVESDVILASRSDGLWRNKRFSGWAAAVSSATLLIVLVGGLSLLIRQGPDGEPEPFTPIPSVSEETIPSVSEELPALTPTPAVGEETVVDVGSWMEVVGWSSYLRGDGGLSRSTAVLWDVTSGGPGLVAVGSSLGHGDRSSRRPDGRVWTSVDGITWNATGDDQESLIQGAVLPLALVDTGQRLVAVGAACDDPERSCPVRPAVWTSPDGAVWTRVPHQQTVFGSAGGIHDVVVTDTGVVAVGSVCAGESCRPAVWTSSDGLTWIRSWEGAATDLGPFLRRPATPVVGGYIDPDVFVEGVPFLEDGAGLLVESWEGDGIRTQVAYPHMHAIAAGPSGLLVAVGVACDDATTCSAAVWTATDSNNWERIQHDPETFQNNTSMHGVAFGASGLVAVGADQSSGVIWTSPDGQTWAEVPGRRNTFASATLSDVVAWGQGYVAVGNHPVGSPRGCCPTGPVWASPDGQTWSTVAELEAFHILSVTAGGPGIIAVGSTGDGGLLMAGIFVAPEDAIPK
jgi:hypothetical protein